jgi:DNA-binding IclR family transcriptional regulator
MADLIQSLTRACRILDVLAAHPEGLPVKKIASLVELNVSTTHHLVNTLRANGYVACRDTGIYSLGNSIARLHNAYLTTIRLNSQFLDVLHTLAERTDETAYVSAWHNGEVVIQAIVEGRQALRLGGLYVGYGSHSHARASGKALLAYLNADALEAYLASHPLVPLTPSTIVSADALHSELQRIAAQGFAIDREEFAEDVCCVAAPVFTAGGEAVSAFTVSVPARRFALNEQQLVTDVVRAARDASAILGFQSTVAPGIENDIPP